MPTYRVTVRIDSALQGTPAYNVWHLRSSNVWLANNETGSALDTLRNFYTVVRGWLPSTAIVKIPYDVVVHGSDYAPGVPGTDEGLPFTSIDQPGTGGTSYAAAPVAACVSWGTSIRSRSARGRTFLGPLNQATMQTDGTLNDTFVAALKTAGGTLITAGQQPGGWAWGVYSRKENVIRDFTSITVRDKVAVLRSRRD